jgi:hypothetical protein
MPDNMFDRSIHILKGNKKTRIKREKRKRELLLFHYLFTNGYGMVPAHGPLCLAYQ